VPQPGELLPVGRDTEQHAAVGQVEPVGAVAIDPAAAVTRPGRGEQHQVVADLLGAFLDPEQELEVEVLARMREHGLEGVDAEQPVALVAQVPGGRVRDVAEFLHGGPDPLPGLLRDPVDVAADHPGDRGLRHPREPSHIGLSWRLHAFSCSQQCVHRPLGRSVRRGASVRQMSIANGQRGWEAEQPDRGSRGGQVVTQPPC
jgi:hypothetical protein